MTTDLAPAARTPGTDEQPRGLAPQGMWWVAWRQHRLFVLVGVGLLALTVLAQLFIRWRFVSTLDTLRNTTPACPEPTENFGVAMCGQDWLKVQDWVDAWSLARLPMLVLPVLLGVLGGATVVSQERDRGTAVFALTQSVSRTRWYLTKCAVVAVPLLVAQAAAGLLCGWLGNVAGIRVFPSVEATAFQANGLVPAALMLLSFGIAIPVGTYVRGVFAALVVALPVAAAVIVGIGYLGYGYLVPHDQIYGPPDNMAVQGVPDGATDFTTGFVTVSGATVGYFDCDYGDGELTEAQVRKVSEACAQRAGVTNKYVSFLSPARYGQLVATLSLICAVIAAFGITLGRWRIRRRVL